MCLGQLSLSLILSVFMLSIVCLVINIKEKFVKLPTVGSSSANIKGPPNRILNTDLSLHLEHFDTRCLVTSLIRPLV